VRKSLSERRIRFSQMNVSRNRARMAAKSSHRSRNRPKIIAKMSGFAMMFTGGS
jgi:hypothetical protein